eukprot:scaffold64197_cov20-Tisochrysis_lutea.AAC.1
MCACCREQLNQLVHLGYHIQALRHFIDYEHSSIGVTKGASGGSIYRRALASGLQGEVHLGCKVGCIWVARWGAPGLQGEVHLGCKVRCARVQVPANCSGCILV